MKDLQEKESEALPLTRAIYGVASLSSFTNSVITQFLSIYGVVLGATFKMMGLITSTQNLFSNLLQVFWGELSDRKGKRTFITLGYLVNSLVITSFLLLKNPFAYVFLVATFSIFWSMTIPAWNSLLGDHSEIASRGRTFGTVNTIIQISNVAAMILVATITYNIQGDTRASNFFVPFSISATTSLTCSILVLFTKEKRAMEKSRGFNIFSGFRDRRFRRYLTASLLNNFAMSFAWPLFPYVTIKIAKAKVWQIALIGAAGSLTSGFTQRLFGRLADKIGRKPLIIMGRMGLLTYPLAYSFAKHWTHLLTINSVVFAFTSFLWMVEPVYIIDQAPEKEKGLYIASNSAIAGIGSFIGSLTGGAVTELLVSSMIINRAVSKGLLISAALRGITSLSYLRIKETLPKE